MNAPLPRQYDLRWRSVNLPALVLLLAAWCIVLAIGAPWRNLWFTADPPAQTARAQAAEDRIDPNTADIPSLRRLPEIAQVRAEAIVAYRAAHGPRAFTRAEDLVKVPGIGPGILERIRPCLNLGDNGPAK